MCKYNAYHFSLYPNKFVICCTFVKSVLWGGSAIYAFCSIFIIKAITHDECHFIMIRILKCESRFGPTICSFDYITWRLRLHPPEVEQHVIAAIVKVIKPHRRLTSSFYMLGKVAVYISGRFTVYSFNSLLWTWQADDIHYKYSESSRDHGIEWR